MKKLAIIVSSIILAVSLAACNKQVVDLTYSYKRAIISLPNGEIVEGKVQSWTDFENGDQIQVKTEEEKRDRFMLIKSDPVNEYFERMEYVK